MIRRLIILLLIVSCGTEPEDSCEVCDVAWLIRGTGGINNKNKLIWEINNKPQFMMGDSIGFTPSIIPMHYDACIETEQTHPLSPDLDCEYLINHYLVTSGDTIYFTFTDSARNILHYVKDNYFEVHTNTTQPDIYYPEDYEIFRFEYKQ